MAIARLLDSSPDAIQVYLLQEVSPRVSLAVFTWEAPANLVGGLARIAHRDGSWNVVDMAQVNLPSSGMLEEGYSAILPVGIGKSMVYGGFVDPTATQVELLDAGGHILDAAPPSSGATLLVTGSNDGFQIRLEQSSRVVAATSVPLVEAINVPPSFTVNPPDWRDEARKFISNLEENPLAAANVVYPGLGGDRFIKNLRPLLEGSQVTSITGRGGSYVLTLSSPEGNGVLFLYLAPYKGAPRVVGYDYRLRG